MLPALKFLYSIEHVRLSVDILKMMMGHPISEKLVLSHQSDHECSGNYHPLTYRYAPGRGKVKKHSDKHIERKHGIRKLPRDMDVL